jgi:hypothetical protein
MGSNYRDCWLRGATDDVLELMNAGSGSSPRDVGSDYSTLMMVMTGVETRTSSPLLPPGTL